MLPSEILEAYVAAPVQNTVANDSVCMEMKSASGTTFAIADISSGAGAGTWYKADPAGGGLCSGASANTFKGWNTKF